VAEVSWSLSTAVIERQMGARPDLQLLPLRGKRKRLGHVGSVFDLIKRATQCGLGFVELLPTTGGLDTVVGQCITPSHEDFASSVVGDAQLGQVRRDANRVSPSLWFDLDQAQRPQTACRFASKQLEQYGHAANKGMP